MSSTWPGAAGTPLAGWSGNQGRGGGGAKIRMTATAMSYCQVPRSYDQKNARERICPRLAMLIRWNAVDDDAVTHVHDAIEIDDGFGIVGDHDDGLAQFFVELAKHL